MKREKFETEIIDIDRKPEWYASSPGGRDKAKNLYDARSVVVGYICLLPSDYPKVNMLDVVRIGKMVSVATTV